MTNGDGIGSGERIYSLIRELYPICRSITGNGTRETIARLQQEIPLAVSEVPSGTEAFDWTVPKEWNIRDAYIKDSKGVRIIDFRQSNLHVLNYSVPVHARMSLEQLRPHLYTLPDRPDWIPYRTSYYAEKWGFCLTHRQYEALSEQEYEVCIDSTLESGYLTYAECLLPGQTDQEVLISCHICHPSLCNDNLSSIGIAVSLAQYLARRSRRYSCRFLFVPGTIGPLVWLSRNRDRTDKIRHGLVLTCLGDSCDFTYKRSRRGNAEIDRVVEYLLRLSGAPHQVEDFSPYGYDERQFCSPGFNLPVGCLTRSFYGRIPQYHTSADNLELVTPSQLEASFHLCTAIFTVLENNTVYFNQKPYGEPQLGKRGLYRPTGGADIGLENMARLWVLNLSDGSNSLLDIAERSKIPFEVIHEAARVLADSGLLADTPPMPTI
jgi:aminopeptidase-like protein